jgi:hypothetical protein
MHTEMGSRPSAIGPWLYRKRMPAFVAVGVVLLATAVWLTQPWNFKTDQRLQPVESVAQAY